MPSTPFMGVRISWLMFARNSDLIRLAASAASNQERELASIGAVRIEPSADMESYPALFFEDNAGSRLELCARRPHAGGQ